jgi:lactate dehydrogenase-like 2-hydroxyacid dehydrogenase
MPGHRVYVTRMVGREALSLLEEKCTVEFWDSEEPVPRETLLRSVKGISGLFCTFSDTIDAEVLETAGNTNIDSALKEARQIYLS